MSKTPTIVETENVPNNIILDSNYPNPFNPVTNIYYEIIKNSFISVKIKDIRGRHIITLVDRYHSMGKHMIQWDGNNSIGEQQTSGIYFYIIDSKKLIY